MNDAMRMLISFAVPGAVGLAAFAAGGIALWRSFHARVRRRLAESGATVPMRCESCGGRFEMSAAEVASPRFTHAPRRQLRVGVVGPARPGPVPAIVGVDKAVSSEHRYECPSCRERTWLLVEDPDRFYDALCPAAGEAVRMLLLVPWGFACLALAATVRALLGLVL